MKQTHNCILALPVLIGILSSVQAADIVVGDVTATLGPDFFFDTAAIGGGDFTSADAFFNRDFGVNGYDPAGTQITITGIWHTNDGRNTFGTLRSSRISLGGTAIAPAVPEILSITRSSSTTNLTWDLNGSSTVTLQRSTTLEPGSFTAIPSRTNTTETSYEETSTDPKAFFRLTTP